MSRVPGERKKERSRGPPLYYPLSESDEEGSSTNWVGKVRGTEAVINFIMGGELLSLNILGEGSFPSKET